MRFSCVFEPFVLSLQNLCLLLLILVISCYMLEMWPFFCDLSHAYFHSLPFLIRLCDGIFHVIFFMNKNLGTGTTVQLFQCLGSRRVPSAGFLLLMSVLVPPSHCFD